MSAIHDADDGASFVDTNILVYAASGEDSERSGRARSLVNQLIESDKLRTSTQVLQELFICLTRKGQVPIAPRKALRYLDYIAAWPVTVTDYRAIREAVDLSIGARLSFWDALIVVAALKSGATRLYTEDLNHGQIIRGIEVVNPFRAI